MHSGVRVDGVCRVKIHEKLFGVRECGFNIEEARLCRFHAFARVLCERMLS